MVISREIKILHDPRLDTVFMVEETIKEHSGEYKKKSLWEHLPRKMMYQTYNVTINYGSPLFSMGNIIYAIQKKQFIRGAY